MARKNEKSSKRTNDNLDATHAFEADLAKQHARNVRKAARAAGTNEFDLMRVARKLHAQLRKLEAEELDDALLYLYPGDDDALIETRLELDDALRVCGLHAGAAHALMPQFPNNTRDRKRPQIFIEHVRQLRKFQCSLVLLLAHLEHDGKSVKRTTLSRTEVHELTQSLSETLDMVVEARTT